MSDADASAVVADDGAAAAVAPVVALWRRCEEARLLQRNARALELADRALEQAQRCLPDDSLVLVWIATEIMDLHSLAHVQLTESGDLARVMEHVRYTPYTSAEAHRLVLTGDCLVLCCLRWAAGTLLRTVRAEKRAFFREALSPARVPPLVTLGEDLLVVVAGEAMFHYLSFRDVAPFETLVIGVRAALTAALSLEVLGALDVGNRLRQVVCTSVATLLRGVFGTGPKRRRMLSALRSGYSPIQPATVAALRRLDARLTAAIGDPRQLMVPREGLETQALAMGVATANQDVARHGLHTCTLPACDAAEPHPRFFKCCSRCRSVYYCSPEHQRQDWPRHRAEDECSKAEAS
jgi:hypothetical protein